MDDSGKKFPTYTDESVADLLIFSIIVLCLFTFVIVLGIF
jgi:hypothetical protein